MKWHDFDPNSFWSLSLNAQFSLAQKFERVANCDPQSVVSNVASLMLGSACARTSLHSAGKVVRLLAARCGHIEVVRFLQEAGAFLDEAATEGPSKLQMQCIDGGRKSKLNLSFAACSER